jgi:hypothetical protein
MVGERFPTNVIDKKLNKKNKKKGYREIQEDGEAMRELI